MSKWTNESAGISAMAAVTAAERRQRKLLYEGGYVSTMGHHDDGVGLEVSAGGWWAFLHTRTAKRLGVRSDHQSMGSGQSEERTRGEEGVRHGK